MRLHVSFFLIECDSSSDEIPTERRDLSSLRAQLSEDQILDDQLGDVGIIEILIAENYQKGVSLIEVREISFV